MLCSVNTKRVSSRNIRRVLTKMTVQKCSNRLGHGNHSFGIQQNIYFFELEIESAKSSKQTKHRTSAKSAKKLNLDFLIIFCELDREITVLG